MTRDYNSEYTASGHHKDYARKIQSEQNMDAMPSKAEMEAERRREERAHAEYKAATALLDRFGGGKSALAYWALADHLGFGALAKVARDASGRTSLTDWGSWKEHHEEPHEKPDPDDLHPQARPVPPFVVNDRVRQNKARAFKRALEELNQIEEIRTDRKIIMPMGGSKARAVVIEHASEYNRPNRRDLYRNGLWIKAMDEDNYSDRTKQSTIDDIRSELREKQLDLLDSDGGEEK